MTLNWRELSSARRTHWPAARGALARPRVVDALNTTLLVVTTPAGYGKTTALAATLPGTGWPAAWLTLDADDADPQVLAAGLALAVAHLPGGHAPGRWLEQGASPVRVASRTADVLHAAQAWLVIDEAHYLTSPLLAPMLRELLDCGRGHVALLSRVALEAAGIVTTLSSADLSFTPEELAELFGAHGQHPTPAEVRMAHALTEGWPIAARYLVQATAQGRVNLRTLRDLDGGDVQLAALFTYLAQVLEQGAPSGTFLERGDWLRLRRTPDLRVDLWEASAALQATPGSPGRLPRLLTLPPDMAESDLPQAQAAARQYALALPQALAEEAELARTQGDLAASRAAAERALSLDPAHEPAARTLMRLHQKSGNAAAIQRVYGQLLDALHPLGLTPLPETALLYQTLKT